MATREDWMRRLGPLYGGAVAVVASTPWRWPAEVRGERRAGGWLVAVGAAIGFAAWLGAALVRAAGLPAAVAAVVALIGLTAGAGAALERGVAAQVARWSGDGDGARGPVAIVTISLLTALRLVALGAVAPGRWPLVLIAMAVVGRWAAVFLQALGDPIEPGRGDGGDDEGPSLVVTPPPLWLAGALSGGATALAIAALGLGGLVAAALTAVLAFLLGLDGQRAGRALGAPALATAAAVGELLVVLLASRG